MRHVFVETNWVVGWAAPAHHKIREAVVLLDRAARGDIVLHVPAICLVEARGPLRRRYQPRNEADAIREFLPWALANHSIDAADGQAILRVLDMFEQRVRSELNSVPAMLQSLYGRPNLDVFALDETMLHLACDLSAREVTLQPFDHAILAAILGRADQLGKNVGELTFCELDGDLQPWQSDGRPKPVLKQLYDERGIWVHGDFSFNTPARPAGWPVARDDGGAS